MIAMVSVIIPAFNAEDYIDKSIESVCSQTYKDLQIIVVDDGSTDGTHGILEEFASRDSRIEIISKANGGVSSARNSALDKVKGTYICFLDSDDSLEEDAIELLVNHMDKSGGDWISSQYSRWDKYGKGLDNYYFIEGLRSFSTDNDRIKFLIEEFLPYYMGFEVWGKLYRNDIIVDKRIRFSDKCSIGEDLAFNIKYLMHSKKLVCISDRCVRHVIRSDSSMGLLKELPEKIKENIYVIEDVWEYAKAIDNSFFAKIFPLISVKMLDNSYIGHTPSEITDAYKEIDETDFIVDRYVEIKYAKKDICAMYPEEIAKLKFRYHMYIFKSLTHFSKVDKIKLFIYDSYRRLRGRPVLENWKMPY